MPFGFIDGPRHWLVNVRQQDKQLAGISLIIAADHLLEKVTIAL